jgi:hypothetical protein
MDIPVSRLNNRMALHTPAEFPLGLVFVVGTVHDLERPPAGSADVRFSLVERGYRLRCHLLPQIAGQVQFEEGQLVRASGHLAFDPMRVDYYLAARDLEVIPGPKPAPPVTDVRPILAEMQQKAKEANMAPGQLPGWVKELAPPEFRESLRSGEFPSAEAETTAVPELTPSAQADQPTTTANDHSTTQPAASPADLNPQLTEFLLKALEAEEDIELTPELIAEYNPRPRPDPTAFKVVYPHEAIPPPPPERIHWFIAVAIMIMVLLILSLVAYLAINAL